MLDVRRVTVGFPNKDHTQLSNWVNMSLRSPEELFLPYVSGISFRKKKGKKRGGVERLNESRPAVEGRRKHKMQKLKI